LETLATRRLECKDKSVLLPIRRRKHVQTRT
jgi:hypothetical protein